MSRILVLEGGSTLGAEFQEHQLTFASRATVMDHWPPPDCDLVLVPADSLDWARQVRQLEIDRHVPMLAMDWPEADRRPVYQAGIDGCLGHPPDQIELSSLLTHLALWTGPAFLPALALENMGSQSVVGQMIQAFHAETPRLLEEVRVAFETHDQTKIAKAAHCFGGGIAIFGPIPSLRACLALEQSGDQAHYLVFLQAVARLQEILNPLP